MNFVPKHVAPGFSNEMTEQPFSVMRWKMFLFGFTTIERILPERKTLEGEVVWPTTHLPRQRDSVCVTIHYRAFNKTILISGDEAALTISMAGGHRLHTQVHRQRPDEAQTLLFDGDGGFTYDTMRTVLPKLLHETYHLSETDAEKLTTEILGEKV